MRATGRSPGRWWRWGWPFPCFWQSPSSIEEVFMRVLIPVAVTTLLVGQAQAADLAVKVEIPRLNVAEYHRPYVAIWVEGPDQKVAANLAVWYDVKQRDDEGSQVAQGHAPVVAPHRPRTDDAGRWRQRRDPRARRTPADLHRRQGPARPSCPRANTSWWSKPRAKSAAANCCACRSSGRPRRPQTARCPRRTRTRRRRRRPQALTLPFAQRKSP